MTDNEIISQTSEKQFNEVCDATDATKDSLSDASVIKALEWCKSRECPECKRIDNEISEESECRLDLMEKVYSLINRQKAEIERYLHSIKLLEKDVAEAQAELKEFKAMYVDKIGEMAIKEFAERLKATDTTDLVGEQYINGEIYGYFYDSAFKSKIDNLVAEMTEQKNEGKE